MEHNNMNFIHPEAKLDPSVQVGPFVYIDKDVEIGAGTVIDANATILEGTRIGKNCHIFPSAVVGAIPQDLKFKGEKTYAFIGDNTTIRECATVHRGTASKGKTVVGNNCLIMAYCHVAHDCILHDHIIMSNATQLAGEVEVDDWAILGGGTLVHQFSHIGAHVMIQGGTRVNKDIPPFIIAARDPVSYCGINSVGLGRRGFTKEQLSSIQETYRLLYMSGLNVSQALQQITETLPQTPERDMIVEFIKASPRGVVRGIN
ncbi:MAG: acyl-ACP--UDP-N-acetylglucosamine O-acyltransferase [Paludibacteraceae bacterium]|nr:acyl-ACP--UDP-N-acetylglucosamine O-acyltransferase [Paludibacteraceae bacterium]